MKPGVKIFLGVFIGVLLLAAIPIYDIYFKDKIDSVDVVVVKAGTEIKAKEPIKESDLTIGKRRRQDLIEDVVLAEEINKVIGYDAAALLVGNSMLSTKMVDYDQLMPDESKGEAIRPITEDMIYAQPGSLRRKDEIDIYTISRTFIKEFEEEGNVVTSNNDTTKKLDLKAPLLQDIKVVYVKDASNKEVTTTDETKADTSDRLNASGTITNLELLLNEEDFQKLMRAVIDEDMKLYITYN